MSETQNRNINQLIDIHSHILPQVDNGSVSMEQTKNMLKIAYEEGITYIIATPHYSVGCRNADKEELYNKLKAVRAEAEKINENFTIDIGNEVYYSEDIIEHLRKEKALTLAGTRYVLVKFAETDPYETIKTGIHRLLIYGYYPILAHVEKYDCLYNNYEDIYNLIHLGCYMQMNISSLNKITDKKTAFCINLIKYDLVHIISTDSHSDYNRAPRMLEGLNRIRKKCGEQVINQLFIENTRRLIHNERI
ncbi:CpsB/CapC family capsule biosynthesis tyrosine phosphatase [Anaerocolumna sp. MB42-C2]|uniref:CpsB/CapC family capsule biosynthesis tyrosine phosphatase n=1 Tax=Anaerocolumna sp. MB42-C2 TaxID=3070997 RepID=UPI0027E17470|nr:CpsB/CapC family capsule biosynthesis tyrosine phosphatase [Anaerocolumna sp. MB42-C2]WMJ85793.1 CpsB/CapC family capsule biosynthesis tyrosine phosphatase [Anaerocolumna sp. MB42-C2]